ncbi:MAG: DUF423 domain-containing protein [Methylococcaceae bacterium]|nr:DUF423 domain-containing protein [Methylococcaceae bacterium]
MPHRFLTFAAISLFLAVAFGAFGAHGLRGTISDASMAVYQTAVQYQFWHSLGLALVAVLARQHPASRALVWAGRLMMAGILIFCGSLYVLVLANLPWLGAVTPIGGTAFLAAWASLALFARSYGK